VLEAPGDVRLVGSDANTEFLMGWVSAFPGGCWTVSNEVASGDWVVDQFTYEGTHEAPLPGPDGEIPATQRRIAIRGVEIFRIVGDKIAEDHIYYDQVQVLEQLGVMPVAAKASA
jgi:predicted ester cyclase